ncbi:WD40 repeat-like protein [Rhizopus microsporus var. microsporus]|uniref:WD40 repeat-like protein n=1 Tax=Rhizopus microsporus var. microsporus TaxID=86635 RepID=A0A1X0QMJ8_RHIZD|nr:WD40 repeat-like protein [Rhizopus microsporus var. microsporus]
MSVPSQTPLNSPTLPSQSDVERIVSNYFIKRGYSASTIQQESISLDHLLQQYKTTNDTCELLKSIQEHDFEDIETVKSSYEHLREWITNALDIYKDELNTIFNTTSIQDQLAHKYTVKLSPIPLELFYRFLHESQHKTLLRIVNQYLIINKLPPVSAGGVSDQGKSMDEARIKSEEEAMELDEPFILPYENTDVQAEIESLNEIRKLVSLGSLAQPTGGFSESFIKVWNLKGEKLRDRNEMDKIRLWCLKTYKNLVCYKSHNYPIWDVDFGPYGFYFATASHDRTARLWSCDHVHPLRIFAGHLSDVNTVKFHPNSKYLVTGSCDKTVRLWDVQRGTCVRVFTGHTGSVHAVAISPNGRWMASAGEDTNIILWDLGSGRRLKTMTGHTGFIYSITFNADSTILVSGSGDGTVRVWDVNKNTPNEFREEQSSDFKRTKLNGKAKDKKDKMKPLLMDLNAKKSKRNMLESDDHLSMFSTRNTPIYIVQFTKRNLCLAAGAKTHLPAFDL